MQGLLSVRQLWFLHFFSVFWSSSVNSHLSTTSLEHVAQKLGSELYRITKAASGHDEIQQGFQKTGMTVERLNPGKIMTDIARNVSAMLVKKVGAVKQLVENAEQMTVTAVYPLKPNNTYYNAKLMDHNNTGFDPMEFIRDARFQAEDVNLTASTVHVPTNIYNKSPAVLNGVNWSSKLDATFRQNLERDPSLKSQYFGSSEGFLRLFPGVKWINAEPDKPDMYDCRLTNWYIRASSSPKDVVILVDISGSMTGIREDIARTTVKEILNTLHEDDFFNIITFREVAEYLDKCTTGRLIQASDITKAWYLERMATLETLNIANYTEALHFAFDLLLSTNNSHSACCNKAIMLISDGAPENFEEIFQQRNPDRMVRVFTYVIGREVTSYEELKEIACNNRGYVTHISTMADVRDHVEVYARVLGRPMVLSRNHTNIWTHSYWHIRNYVEVLARPVDLSGRIKTVSWSWHESGPWNFIGMVITVAQPVFNRAPAAANSGKLVGVVGIDVPVSDIKRLMKPYKWGVGSYIMGANHNGHVLFHPYWRLTTKKSNQPRHSYNEVDLGQVELPLDVNWNKTSQGYFSLPLRKLMIDQKTGNLSMRVLRQLDERKRVYEREYVYYYAGVNNSQLSIALAIPARQDSDFRVPVGTLEKSNFNASALLADNSTQLRLHPEWAYCNATLASAQEIFYYVFPGLRVVEDQPDDATQPTIVNCDDELVGSLLFDLKSTQPAVDHWRQAVDLQKKYSIETAFVVTRAGATRWYDFPPLTLDESSDLSDGEIRVIRVREADEYDEVVEEEGNQRAVQGIVVDESYYSQILSPTDNSTADMRHFLDVSSRAVDEAFYERTVMSDNELTVTVGLRPGADFGELSSFMASVPVFVGATSVRRAPAAVSGVFMKIKRLRELLLEISHESCKDLPDCLACHSSSVSCFLLDENGYIVTSTSYTDPRTKFFGAAHGEVMEALIENEIFQRYSLHDYQGTCEKPPKRGANNAAFSLRPWMNSVLNSVHFLATHTFTIFSSLFLGISGSMDPDYFRYEPTTLGPLPESEVNEEEEAPEKNKTLAQPPPLPPSYKRETKLCDMKYDLYHSTWTGLSTNFTIDCRAGCVKNVGVYKVSMTNMLLIAMDKAKACPCTDDAMLMMPVEFNHEKARVCEKLTAVPYRRQPSDCFTSHPSEDSKDCFARPPVLSGSSALSGTSMALFSLSLIAGALLPCL